MHQKWVDIAHDLPNKFVEVWQRFEESKENPYYNITPPIPTALKVFSYNPYDFSVCILGQDPYPEPGVADGYAFSSGLKHKIPASLKNIRKELIRENLVKEEDDFDVDLERWVKQGVLLLNTALTTEYNKPGAHKKIWKPFTDYLIDRLAGNIPIWCLWGKEAQKYEAIIKSKTDYILKAPHPSPLARGFVGCNHFTTINDILKGWKAEAIKW